MCLAGMDAAMIDRMAALNDERESLALAAIHVLTDSTLGPESRLRYLALVRRRAMVEAELGELLNRVTGEGLPARGSTQPVEHAA